MAASTITLVNPSSRRRVEYYLAPASTAFTYGTLVSPNEDTSTTTFIPTTSSTKRVLGRILKTIASTDSDYASIKSVPVEVDEDGEYEVAATNATANKVQSFMDFADNQSVATSTTTNSNFFMTKFISTTKIRGKIVRPYQQSPVAN